MSGQSVTTPVDYEDAHPVWSCRRKKGYPTRVLAEKTARAITAQGFGVVRAYGCRHCGFWHVGGAPGMRVSPPSDVERPKPVRRRASKGDSYENPRRRRRREHYDNDSEEDG